MIAVDTNVVVDAHNADSARHQRARAALRSLAEGDEPWALPVFVLGEFLRVVTHPRIFATPSTRVQATAALTSLLAGPSVRVLSPSERFWPLLQSALEEGEATGNLVFDAQIVAVCREHGVSRLLTSDRDFRRFPSLTVELL